MKRKVLYIDCCIRGEQSRTAKLAEAFLSALPPECAVTRLDLAAEGLQPLYGPFFEARERLLEAGALDHPRFRYAHQLAETEIAVIAAPFWDLSFPALLKIYIENVSVEGITFRSSPEGLQGLCRGTDLVFLTTRGGIYGEGHPLELGTAYLRGIQQFFGFGQFHAVAADGLDVQGFDGQTSLKDACEQAVRLAKTL